MPLFRAFQDAGGAPGATGIVHRFCQQRAHVLSAYIGSGNDIVGPWKRTTSPQTHGRLFQANVSHYKQQLADKLSIEPGQPGSIHFGPESRGFDEEFFLQLLSEHKELKLSRGMRTIQWKRIRDRNEGLDMTVMILCLLDVFRSQVDRMTEPQLVQENGEKGSAQPEPGRPKWGVIHRPTLPNDTDGMEENARQFFINNMGGQPARPQDERSPWGVRNKPVVW